MSEVDPATFTMGDMVNLALRTSGWLGVGQTANAQDFQDGWAALTMLLNQWARQRWLIYHLVDLAKVSTGATSYTVGPGGDFNTGTISVRPNRLEAAYLRQIATGNNVDYPMGVLNSLEDYSKIRLKSLQSFPQYVFLDPNWPAGQVYFWPVPQSAIYEMHIVIRAQLPSVFANQAANLNVPYEYHNCILWNLALAIMTIKQIPLKPGSQLPILAKNALSILRQGNTAISRLGMPSDLTRSSQYNIFSDQGY